jgi:serine/threonine protein phosphatase PrpC
VISDSEAVRVVCKYRNPLLAACALRDRAYALGSDDNLSVVVIRLTD